MNGRLPIHTDGEAAPVAYGRWIEWTCWALVISGAALRVYQWLNNRSLRLDESYLAVNILERGFGDLHRPLEYDQSAPWLFLVASKAMATLWGPSEMTLRFVPLIASILSPWAFWRLARECLAGWMIPVALAIFSYSSPNVYYAQEVKQYSVEVLVSILIVWQAALMFKSAASPDRHLTGLVISGSIGIFAMHALPFVLAGIGLVAIWARWKGTLHLSYGRLFFAIGVWLGFFALNYIVIIRPNYTNAVMKNYWAFAYPGLPWTVSGLLSWKALVGEYFWYLGYAGWFKVLLGALMLVGLGWAIRARSLVMLVCVVTLAVYWLAAMAGKAPFYGRLALFLFPFLALLTAQGLSAVVRGRYWQLGVLVVGVALWTPVKQLARAFSPIENENLRDPIVQLSKLHAGSTPVYVAYWGVPGLRYYRQALSLPNLSSPNVVLGHSKRVYGPPTERGQPPVVSPDLQETIREISPLVQGRELWMLIAHLTPEQEQDLVGGIRAAFGLVPGTMYKARWSTLYRFDPKPDASPRSE